MLRSILIGSVGLMLGAGLVSSCQKNAPDPPYYRFSADDRRWMQHQVGDEWRFENGRGQQRVYRIERVFEKLKQNYDCCPISGPALPFPGSGSRVLYQYDQWAMAFQRVDTVGGASGTIGFQRPVAPEAPLPEKAPANAVLGAAGGWQEYIGSPGQSGRLGCFELEWQADTTDVNLRPSTPLVVNGQRYDHVVTFAAAGQPNDCAATGLPRPRIRRLYYDRQYGIVRMESVTGEVWDRVR